MTTTIYGIGASQGSFSAITTDILFADMYRDYKSAAVAAERRAEEYYPEYDGFTYHWEGDVLVVMQSTVTIREFSIEPFTLH